MRKKIVILALIFSLGFSVPLYATRSAAMILWVVKEFGLDLVARAIARKLLTALQDGIINSINNIGLEKGQKVPGFVQNWKKFLSDAQSIGENQFRAQLSYTIRTGILCNDLKGPLALAFQAGNVPFVDIGQPDLNAELKQATLTPYQSKIKCTIPDKVREDFKKNFEKGGGWETWSRLVEPQNNLAGSLALSLEELAKQRASQENARQGEAVAGQGFSGVQDDCRGTGKNSECSFLGKIVTPGKLLGKGAEQWLDSNAQWFVSADELSEVLVNILNAAINKLGSFATRGHISNITNVVQDATDTSGTSAGGLTSGARADCISACVANSSGACSNPLSTPEEKNSCENNQRSACEQRCAVP